MLIPNLLKVIRMIKMSDILLLFWNFSLIITDLSVRDYFEITLFLVTIIFTILKIIQLCRQFKKDKKIEVEQVKNE